MLLASWSYGKVGKFWGSTLEPINSCSLSLILVYTCKSNIIIIPVSLARFQGVLILYRILSALSQKDPSWITSVERFCNENHLRIFHLATLERALKAQSIYRHIKKNYVAVDTARPVVLFLSAHYDIKWYSSEDGTWLMTDSWIKERAKLDQTTCFYF